MSFFKECMHGDAVSDACSQDYRRVMLMHALTLMLALSLTLLTLYHLLEGNTLLGMTVALFTLVCVYSLVHYRLFHDLEFASTLGAFSLFICLIAFIAINENRDYGLIWSIFFPLYVFPVKGVRTGLIYTVVYYAVLFLIAFEGVGAWDSGRWDMTGYLRFVLASIVLTYAAYSFERSNDEAYDFIHSIRNRDRERMQQLELLSLTDPLTGLYNRRYLDEIVTRIFNTAKRHNYVFALYIIDLDDFKAYNDCYGHQAGDRVLEKVASVLHDVLRRSDDYAFRLGGEEFCCIVMGTDEKSVTGVAKKICSRIEALQIPHKKSSVIPVVSASVGVCLIDHVEHETFDTMYKVADAALYKAKDEGRNRVVVYRSDDI
jgi:diguanylate cyclase (GGDEF)-like protein